MSNVDTHSDANRDTFLKTQCIIVAQKSSPAGFFASPPPSISRVWLSRGGYGGGGGGNESQDSAGRTNAKVFLRQLQKFSCAHPLANFHLIFDKRTDT